MCGIVGYTGKRPVVDILVAGLRRLEYRGYDSAGIAAQVGTTIEIVKAEGKLENVEKLLPGHGPKLAAATCGIGHTRWATHGKPTTQNAHPHQTGHVVLVHNGIIENYQELREELIANGHQPRSETDSELFGFLVLDEMEKGTSLTEAVRVCFRRVHGACSIVVMSEREPGVVVGVRAGSPLVAATDPQGGAFLASDAQPLLGYTKDVYFLEHGDIACGTAEGLRFISLETGRPVERRTTRLDWSPEALDKRGFPHFMLKEIHEQPAAIVDTLNALLDRGGGDPFSFASADDVRALEEAREIVLVACGTAWHAAMMGKYWLERLAKVSVSVDLASEFRYREPMLGPGTVVVAVSQSGETADTLAAVREAKNKGVPSVAITNCRGSTISREADVTLYTAAGPEIGVAATKTFATQMLTLLLLAGRIATRHGQDPKRIRDLFEEVLRLPHLLASELTAGAPLVEGARAAANALHGKKGFFFIGRGYSFPIALEGALKLKEISYLHAEGYAAGELKHGPIAMIDREMVVVVLAPRDHWRDKTISNLEEVKARGAIILGVGAEADRRFREHCSHWIPMREPVGGKALDEGLMPFQAMLAVQLLSYEIAVLRGTDVDKPRNLAKSVTVE